MPPDIAAACGAQTRGYFDGRPVRVWLLHDVFVAMEGLVFDRGGNLYAPSATQHHPSEIEWAAQRVIVACDDPATPRFDLPLILGRKRGASNYGHWLMEMLPALHLVRNRFPGEGLGVLVHDVTEPQLGGVMLHSLRRIGVADHLVRVAGVQPVRVDSLLLVQGLTDHGVYMSPLVSAAPDRLVDGIRGGGHERVFIRRGHGLRRDFDDPGYIEELAREAGYTVFDPAGLPLETQMAAMRDARVVAGAMGAAMTNLVFSAPEAEIRMFAGAAMPDTFFWFVATVTGRRYRELRCPQTGEAAGMFYDRALLPPDHEVRAFLAV